MLVGRERRGRDARLEHGRRHEGDVLRLLGLVAAGRGEVRPPGRASGRGRRVASSEQAASTSPGQGGILLHRFVTATGGHHHHSIINIAQVQVTWGQPEKASYITTSSPCRGGAEEAGKKGMKKKTFFPPHSFPDSEQEHSGLKHTFFQSIFPLKLLEFLLRKPLEARGRERSGHEGPFSTKDLHHAPVPFLFPLFFPFFSLNMNHFCALFTPARPYRVCKVTAHGMHKEEGNGASYRDFSPLQYA